MNNLTEAPKFKSLKIDSYTVKHIYENNLILIDAYKKDYEKWGLKRFSDQITELKAINAWLISYASKKTKSNTN